MRTFITLFGVQKLVVSHKKFFRRALLLLVALLSAAPWAPAADSAKPFLGNWALTLPTGGAGWLGVTEWDGQLQASLLWGGGSVLPVANVKVEGDQLFITRT